MLWDARFDYPATIQIRGEHVALIMQIALSWSYKNLNVHETGLVTELVGLSSILRPP